MAEEIRIEIRARHPAELDKEEQILFEEILEGEEVQVDTTVEVALEASVSEDKRPLLIELRKISGDLNPLGDTLFTLTGYRPSGLPAGEGDPFVLEPPRIPVEYRFNVFLSVALTTNFYTAAYAVHSDPVEFRRLHVTWAQSNFQPIGSAGVLANQLGGASVPSEAEVTMFASADAVAI